jgi:hypothetical protein
VTSVGLGLLVPRAEEHAGFGEINPEFVAMLFEQMQQVGAVQEGDILAFGELVRSGPNWLVVTRIPLLAPSAFTVPKRSRTADTSTVEVYRLA